MYLHVDHCGFVYSTFKVCEVPFSNFMNKFVFLYSLMPVLKVKVVVMCVLCLPLWFEGEEQSYITIGQPVAWQLRERHIYYLMDGKVIWLDIARVCGRIFTSRIQPYYFLNHPIIDSL